MQTYRFDALGTHWTIETFGTPLTKQARRAIIEQVSAFEDNYSRFRPSSLLSQLNNHKQLANPPAEMVAMLRFALDMYGQTGGLFNISVGSRLEQLGYGKQADQSARISTALADELAISDQRVVLHPRVRLDFGGFGKGWLIDQLGQLLTRLDYQEFCINGGGDILVQTSQTLDIAIEHPYDATLSIGTARLQHGAIAASSGQKRVWQQPNGQKLHHLLHPATGLPGGSVASLHVVAPTALLADTLSTVLLLADEKQRSLLAARFKVPYLAVGQDLQYFQSREFPALLNT